MTAIDLRHRVIGLLDAAEDDPLDYDDFLEIPGCGSILALLDDLSRTVQGLPLLPTDEQRSAWLKDLEDGADDQVEDDWSDDGKADDGADAQRPGRQPRRG